MKRQLLTYLTTSLLTISGLSAGFAQSVQNNDAPASNDQNTITEQSRPIKTKRSLIKDSTTGLEYKALKSVSTDRYENFRKSIKPLIVQMSTKKIVALGEGTWYRRVL